MAKYRRRKYWKRKSGRWCSNIQELSFAYSPLQGVWHEKETLMTNPTQTVLGVSQRYTVKNIEMTLTFETDSDGTSLFEDLTAYIMYVPQGMVVDESYNIQHPEYIMAYRFIGSPHGDNVSQEFSPIKIKTRLARKLETGDNIIIFMKGHAQSSTAKVIRINGLVRWWSKAN